MSVTPPFEARHIETTLIASADDEPGRPSEWLIRTALRAAEKAISVDLSEISRRLTSPPLYPDVWPGEHYRLLTAFVQILEPKLVIEIGTATGISALALKAGLPPDGVLETFDIYPWNSFHYTVFQPEDFGDGRLEQHVADLSVPDVFESYRKRIEQAGILFVDAAKDGVMEQRLIDLLDTVSFPQPPLVIFDDIKLWNMLGIWRRISRPRLDFTSLGHWSGTGLVEWR